MGHTSRKCKCEMSEKNNTDCFHAHTFLMETMQRNVNITAFKLKANELADKKRNEAIAR